MLTRETLAPEEKEKYNQLATHVIQSWEWGEFREKTGVKVIRPGVFEGKKLISAYQLTIHPIPHTSYTIGYLPKGHLPDPKMLEVLEDIGARGKTIFFKLEPNIEKERFPQFPNNLISQYPNLLPSPRPLFTKYTFQIDLTKAE